MSTKDYRKQVASVRREGWSRFLCKEEDPKGRPVLMPQWVMDDACRHVDACTGVAIRVDQDGFRIVNAYIWSELELDFVSDDFEEAVSEADSINESRGVVPLVIPNDWATVGRRSGGAA